jgi:hypothetical protein
LITVVRTTIANVGAHEAVTSGVSSDSNDE